MVCAHTSPQSWRNTPTPNTPLAPNKTGVLSIWPEAEQGCGTAENCGSLMIWTGSEDAVSLAILTSAILTGPHVLPSAKGVHSTSARPSLSACCGKAMDGVRAEAKMRTPDDPVSTKMLSMTWQALLPG